MNQGTGISSQGSLAACLTSPPWDHACGTIPTRDVRRLVELGYIEDVNSLEQAGELLTTFCPPALSSARLLDDVDFKG